MRPIGIVVGTGHHNFTPALGGSSPSGYAPAQILQAYGFNQLSLNGTGQTIAIVDASNDPNLAGDLATFDQEFNLPAPPSFSQVDEHGNPATSSLPTDPTGDWEVEESLDVEWAHAIAPKANILLVEASSADTSDLLAAIDTARNAKGVVAVSLSWGGPEAGSQTAFDSHLTTPAGHPGITFFASSGDSGTPAGWPATSPNVVGVGGTTLTLNSSNNRSTETGWMGSGGGYSSVYSTEPSYQSTYAASSYVQNTLGNTVLLDSPRGAPDVSFDADPNTGVAVYDSYPYEGAPLDWVEVGGTSAAAPQWAGLMALVDQGRGALGSLDGPSQTLPALYQLGANASTYNNDFYDVTSGGNGLPAKVGYDLVTGLGSPKANNLIPALEQVGVSTVLSVTTSTSTPTAGTAFSVTVTAENAAGQTLTTYTGTVHFTTSDTGAGIVLPANYTFTTADNGSHTFTNGVTLVTAGSQTVTATDTSNSAITGQATVTVGAAAASTLTLSAPSSSSQNGPFTVTVTATDPYGNLATGYVGTVSFTTSDTGPGVVLPGNYTFGLADKGSHTFTNGVTLVTLGNQTVTVTDTVEPTLTSTATVNVQSPLSATHLSVSAPTVATAGAAFSITVTALNANNNTATGYLGTIHFTTSDQGAGALVPADYTFTPADHGTHTFTNGVTLVTAGSQTLTATDTSNSTINGAATVSVTAAAASKLLVAGFPSPTGVGSAGNFTVTAQDPYGNIATGYTGTVAFSSSDSQALLPGNSTLNNGTGTFSATFETAGIQALTATDTVTKSITGTQTGIQVVYASLPIVTGMLIDSGSTAGGYQIAISGMNLAGATAVDFGTSLAIIEVDTATVVDVVVPPHMAGTVNVTVTTPAGTSAITPADQFTYLNGQTSGPTVTSVSPNSGSTAGGYPVTISGSNLGGAINVSFGGTLTMIQSDTSTAITVTAPAHAAGTVDVTVTTSLGTSPTSPADQFTYQNGQTSGPTVTSVSPNSGTTAGGYSVTISGSNLGSAINVSFGGTLALIQSDTSTAITVTAPAHAAGTVDVTVTTSLGTSPTSPADQFTFQNGQASGPAVTSVSPNSGSTAGGYSVTISGSNLGGATAVSFGGTVALIQSDTSTTITVTAPAHAAGTVDVTVTTSGGTSPTSPADQFTYVSGPTVLSVSPNLGSTAGGYQIAISGTNLAGATAVYFGMSFATILGSSATSLSVIAPAHAAGTVDVTVITPTGTSPISPADHFTYTTSQPPAPTVQKLSPKTGSTIGGYQVAIFGTNFTGATAVYFGTTPAVILGVTPTSIAVTAPSHLPGVVDVRVVTPGGTSAITSADRFSYEVGPAALFDYIPALEIVLASWSPTTATQQQVNYLVAEILTNGGVPNFLSYFEKK